MVENPFRERRKLATTRWRDLPGRMKGICFFLRAPPTPENISVYTHGREENCDLEFCKNLFTNQRVRGKEVEATRI